MRAALRHAARPARIALASAIALAALLALSLHGCGSSGETATPPAGQESPAAPSEEAVQAPEEPHGGQAADSEGAPDADGDSANIPSDAERVAHIMEGLTIEQKVAQLFFVRPESITGVSVATQAGDATREAIERYPVGGIVYFASNLIGPDQTRQLLGNTQRYAVEATGVPVFLGVDEEGGTVTRIGGNPGFDIENVGDMSAVADEQSAYDVAARIGAYLSDLGFNVDFAPDADIANNPASDTMARRAFGATAEEAAPKVAAQVEGLADQGILSAAKHFPGIGGAEGDSHDTSIYSHKTFEQMAAEELVPFEAAIEAGVPFVMVGHLSTPEATGNDLPASVSSQVIEGLLRDELGYGGIVITDSLEMGAVCDLYSPADIGVAVLEAGADMILMPADFAATYRGVLDAVDSGRLSEERIDTSVERIISAKLALMD